MLIKAIGPVIHWDRDHMVILNPGDEGELSDTLAQGEIDAKNAKAVTAKAAPAPIAPPVIEEVKIFTAEHVGGGYYKIVGPDAPEGKFKKALVPAKLEELEAAYAAAKAVADQDEGAGDDAGNGDSGDEGELSDTGDDDEGAADDEAPVA